MRQFIVTGMSCAACAARVEKAVSALEGVTACSVNLLTNSMGVEGDVSSEAVVRAVEAAGYGAKLKNKSSEERAASPETGIADTETRKMKRRLCASLCFLFPLLYLSMGYTMLGFPLPEILAENDAAIALCQMLLAGMVLIINQKFFVNGFRGILHLAPNMDSLVAIGSGASFLYSTYLLFTMTEALKNGDFSLVSDYRHGLYYESAAMILALITVGKMLESRAKGKTTDALKGLMDLSPKTAILLQEGEERTVPVSDVRIGDRFAVKPGGRVPVDGVVVNGTGAVDEAALTGESLPVEKAEGDMVYAATTNTDGYLVCEAARVGEDTTLSQIIAMVSESAATKAPIAKTADRVAGVFVPTVMGIAAVTVLLWLLAGESPGFAIARGICVLVISCPCALGLATPVAIMVGNGVGARNGILFKTSQSLEQTGKTQIVVLDKTGTITKGEPEVTDILPAEGWSEKELLYYAGLLEARSEHPLARAILKCAPSSLYEEELLDFHTHPGLGLSAIFQDRKLCGGSLSYISRQMLVSPEMRKLCDDLSGEGKTPLLFGIDHQLLGMIAVADTVKEDSREAIAQLKGMGIRVVMLTGDQERTAEAIGKTVGVDHVIAGVLPEGKNQVIQKLKGLGHVMMVGDGINDAPALTSADTGIAIGAGTDIAIDAADVVLMKSRLSDVCGAIRLSRATLQNIRQNLFWAFFYNAIGIPLAAGLYYPLFGWKLSPMFGAAAMSLSSFCVVSNALRLYLVNVQDHSKDRILKMVSLDGFSFSDDASEELLKEDIDMKKTMKIEGMMCPHCEARVKKTLEALPQVEEAIVSFEAGTAVVTLSAEITDEELKAAVEAQEYPVTEIH